MVSEPLELDSKRLFRMLLFTLGRVDQISRGDAAAYDELVAKVHSYATTRDRIELTAQEKQFGLELLKHLQLQNSR